MRDIFRNIKKDHIFIVLLMGYVAVLCFFAFFRDMMNDEFLYFNETYLISELFKAGEWIGAYGVGVHGFLFKIPPALIFLLTGPSVTVVTVYHIILAVLVAILSYKLFSHVLKEKTYGILATAILLSNFHFFLTPTTYLREVPSILVVLILLNHIIRKGREKNFILSLLFLLLLDVKEYVFVIFALFYVVWLFIDSKEDKFLARVWDVIKQSFVIFLPSLAWIVLMFTTHVIPVNMFLASIIGLKDNTFGYLLSHFDIENSTHNALEGGRDMPLILIKDIWSPLTQFLCNMTNIVLSYIGKILYPRVFSFLSIPKVVIFPVVVSAILTLKNFIISKKKKEKTELRNLALLSMLLLTWLTIYILRASHGRYLLPVVPAIAGIYLYLLFKQKLNIKQKKVIIIGTILYVSAGVYFETNYVLPKVLLEYSILTLFLTTFLKPHLEFVKYLLISLLVAGSMATAVLFSYVQGQVYGYKNLGVNRNAYEISTLLPDEGMYWINTPRNLPLILVYNGETYLKPEWKWRLHEIVPIRDSLKTYGERQALSFAVKDLKTFRKNIKKYHIEEVFMIITEVEYEAYPDQEYLEPFMSQTWLEFKEKVEYKGMVVYIFKVLE